MAQTGLDNKKNVATDLPRSRKTGRRLETRLFQTRLLPFFGIDEGAQLATKLFCKNQTKSAFIIPADLDNCQQLSKWLQLLRWLFYIQYVFSVRTVDQMLLCLGPLAWTDSWQNCNSGNIIRKDLVELLKTIRTWVY